MLGGLRHRGHDRRAGPGFAILLLIILPFLWGLPQALVCSELGSAIPEDGGLYRWSRRANGEFWGFQTGWWWVLSIFVDSAVYIALTVDYAQTWFHLTGLERWGLAVVLIAIFAYVNIRGLQLASWMLVILQVIVFVPFMALAVLGLAHWHYDPFHPILLPGVSLIGGVGVALSVGIWMYSGFECLSTMAGEIKSPQRVIPRAVMFTLPIVLAFYVLSTMGGMAAVGHLGRLGHERQVRLHGRGPRGRRPDAAAPVLRRHAGRQLRPVHRLSGGRRATLVRALQRQADAEVPRQGEQVRHAVSGDPADGRCRRRSWCAGASRP